MSAKHTPEPWAEPDANHCDTRLIPLVDYKRARVCVNACAGIEDPAEAIREAREALERCYQVHNAITTYSPQSYEDHKANKEHCEMIKKALAKLQPKESE